MVPLFAKPKPKVGYRIPQILSHGFIMFVKMFVCKNTTFLQETLTGFIQSSCVKLQKAFFYMKNSVILHGTAHSSLLYSLAYLHFIHTVARLDQVQQNALIQQINSWNEDWMAATEWCHSQIQTENPGFIYKVTPESPSLQLMQGELIVTLNWISCWSDW